MGQTGPCVIFVELQENGGASLREALDPWRDTSASPSSPQPELASGRDRVTESSQAPRCTDFTGPSEGIHGSPIFGNPDRAADTLR